MIGVTYQGPNSARRPSCRRRSSSSTPPRLGSYSSIWSSCTQLVRKAYTQARPSTSRANEDEIIRTDVSRAALIGRLLDENHGQEIWETLIALQPDLALKLTAALELDRRTRAVEQFEHELEKQHLEGYWKSFFKEHVWMFGGSHVAILDEARIDIESTTDLPIEVEGGFMDIVELKRPDSEFWAGTTRGGKYLYRGKHLVPHYELEGAIAQLTSYILQAEKQVANTDFLRVHDVRPLKPRGLVVHGRSDNWGDHEWNAFRLLNDNLHGIQVMTFDHLLAQARRAVDLSQSSEE